MRIDKHLKQILLAAAFLLLAMPGYSVANDGTKIKGLITAVNGNTITVKDQNNATQTFTVSSSTDIRSTKGMTGVIGSKVEASALIPGLPISAEVADGAASKISFKSEDFKTAQQIQAGLAPTEQRMNEFGTYEALASTDVFFASGSATISAQGKSDLAAFAAKAKATQDYLVIVTGFTDSTGNAAANQKLSAQRAAAVTNYLQQQQGLAPGRVKAPDGMGVAQDAGTGSNAGARKVNVKLVVDKGVQAGKN